MANFSSFGAPATTTTLGSFGGFGVTSNTTPTSSFATSGFSGSNTNVSSSNVGFGAMPSMTAPSIFGNQTATGLGFPLANQAQTPSTGFVGFGGSTLGASTMGFGTNLAAAAVTTTTTTVGLGGVDSQAIGTGDASAFGKKDSKAVLEAVIPAELVGTVETLKKHIKDQKTLREEMSRVSSKTITSVHEEVNMLQRQLTTVISSLQRSALTITRLKQDTFREQSNADIIHRTKDTPLVLQYENTAPSLYFHNLANNFEHQMQSYRQQIEQLERHLTFLSQPTAMTPDELTAVMWRLHESFVTLAAQLQTVHQQVQYQKEQFSAIQRAGRSGMADIFETNKSAAKPLPNSFLTSIPVITGPSLAASPASASFVLGKTLSSSSQPQGSNLSFGSHNSIGYGQSSGLTGSNLMNNTQQSLGSSFGLPNASSFKPIGQASVPSFGTIGGSNMGLLGSDNSLQSPYGANSQKPFQLQKPPSGNKRGKRWTST